MLTPVFSYLVVCMAGLVVAADAVSAAAPIRIMPFGDSITGSPGCWRALLWRKLQTAGFTANTTFVGTLPGPDCGFAYGGGANEGHGGFLASGIVANNQLPGWLAKTHPDIVMMHLGTNDVWSNEPPATITANFSVLVQQMRASKPSMRILVAQILAMAPTRPANCPDCPTRVVAFNKAIAAWVEDQNKNTKDDAAAIPLTLVDCWTGFDDATDTIDGVHPNSAGNAKMAASWYGPLVAAIEAS
ncbi:hypothetical protein SCUCBS95973_001313 [Sporothrix curviconia]|uniref:SGNH hydrolase-type esterase domain-containing protein n=1 Tax=Sporothrix curviconia TaxID=1260050 RepID=A0ABP0AXR7_9PEZI